MKTIQLQAIKKAIAKNIATVRKTGCAIDNDHAMFISDISHLAIKHIEVARKKNRSPDMSFIRINVPK